MESNGNEIKPPKVNGGEKNKKKLRKKKKKKERRERNTVNNEDTPMQESVEIEYITVNPLEQMDPNDPLYQNFADVFQHFEAKEEQNEAVDGEGEENSKQEESSEKVEEEKKVISKKERKRQKRLSIAVLKQLVKRPEVVEAWDVTAADPGLLTFLKAYRNTVIVPRHWNQKRKYLQGKRGIEKPPFQLPEFIAATGISKIRQAIQQKEDSKKAKQKQREKMQPKMGKMDIDYQVLHDAFFKYQTKPKLTIHGDLYYEGKEFEITLKEKKPGHLSEELKKGLGMPEGAPPPWLINMQRYGPPPSYPGLKIPGLNAPIPEGCRYGYHPGGWGKPPVDEFGRPLYGDVWGTAPPEPPPEITQPIERKHWGEMEEEEEEEEVEEQEEAQNEEAVPHPSGIETPSGFVTPSGMETPESLELRKAPPAPKKDDDDDSNKQLFQVLEQKDLSVGTAVYGSSHKYVIPEKRELKAKNQVDLIKSQASEKLDIALNPSDIENLQDIEGVLKQKYEQALSEKHQVSRENVSDIIAEHSKKKRKKEHKSDSKSKKYKDFKF